MMEMIVANQKGHSSVHSYGESHNKRAGRVSVLLRIRLPLLRTSELKEAS